MVTIFNRKRLLIETSQVECNRVKQILKVENVEFYYNTVKSSPMMSRRMDVAAQSSIGLPYRTEREGTSFIYTVYVKRKDYKRAVKLVYGK